MRIVNGENIIVQLSHFHCNKFKSPFFESGDDFTDDTSLEGARFDDY